MPTSMSDRELYIGYLTDNFEVLRNTLSKYVVTKGGLNLTNINIFILQNVWNESMGWQQTWEYTFGSNDPHWKVINWNGNIFIAID